MLCELAVGLSCVLLLPVLAVAAFFLLKSRMRPRDDVAGALHRPQWERDVVYLVQFPTAPHCRTISPFALKLETWLRASKVKYEPVYSLKFSTATGQIPYVELNGEEMADSNVIISRLRQHFKVGMDSDLTESERGAAHLATVALENHTAIAGFYWRYGFNMDEFTDILCKGRMPARILGFWKRIQPFGTRFKTRQHGLARHTKEEVEEFSCQDLKALADMLGDKPYFFGSNPHTLDCAAFGHLAQFAYIPMAFPQQIYMKANCKNLLRFVDRMRAELWPDWEEMCTRDCMVGNLGKDKSSFDSIFQ